MIASTGTGSTGAGSWRRRKALLGAVLVGGLAVVVVATSLFVAYLADPSAGDGCLEEWRACVAGAEGLAEEADCGVELYHCRVLGEHREH